MKLPVTMSRAFRFAVLAGVVAGLTVTPAAASQGQPVLAGQVNTETADSTAVWNTTFFPGTNACTGSQGGGLTACGDTGVEGVGTATPPTAPASWPAAPTAPPWTCAAR